MSGAKSSGQLDFTYFVRAMAAETDNADVCLTNGWYWLKENAQGCPVNGAPLFIVGGKDRVWQYTFDSQNGSALRRHTVDGGATWEPWEWENPPVADEAEYRTTKRYGGKSVYTKRITVKNAPDSALAVIPHGLEGVIPIGWVGIATNGETVLALPFLGSFTVGVDSTNITLSTTEDYSSYTVEITLWYCKGEED